MRLKGKTKPNQDINSKKALGISLYVSECKLLTIKN